MLLNKMNYVFFDLIKEWPSFVDLLKKSRCLESILTGFDFLWQQPFQEAHAHPIEVEHL